MKYSEYKYLVCSDLYRITGRISFGVLLRHLLLGETYKCNFWLRTCCFAKSSLALKFTVYPIARLICRHLSRKLGILIPPVTKIGSGFYSSHYGGIVVNRNSVIGKNCNISHGVTLGQSSRGKNIGHPILGDNIYIGPGAKIIGAVRIGNNVAIGANCVVTKDVPDNSVVVGIPGRVISSEGAEGYVNGTDYEDKIA